MGKLVQFDLPIDTPEVSASAALRRRARQAIAPAEILAIALEAIDQLDLQIRRSDELIRAHRSLIVAIDVLAERAHGITPPPRTPPNVSGRPPAALPAEHVR